MNDENVKKQLERIGDRQLQQAFIGDLVIEIWEHIEYYRDKHRPDNCAVEFTYDKICASLFTYLDGFLDTKKIAERD